MKKIFIDIVLVTVSIYLAIYLVHSGAIPWVVAQAHGNILLVSLIAGLFFTSFFTTPPAIAVFSGLAHSGNPLLIAAIGGLGSVCGDSLIFLFVRGRVTKDAGALMSGPRLKRLIKILKRRHFQRVLPLIGGLIIASPLPDELGLALIGVSNMKRSSFFLLSYCMNALGILAILLLSGAL